MKTILYLGTDPARFSKQQKSARIIHYPVIVIAPRIIDDPIVRNAYKDFFAYTHVLFTSINAVRIFFEHLEHLACGKEHLKNKTLIAIGKSTAHALTQGGHRADIIAERETQEGLIEKLQELFLKDAYILYPRSSIARPHLLSFFQEKNIRCVAFDLYDTHIQKIEPIPDLETIDEIVFTSPSTVRAFVQIFGHLPKDKKLHAIGPITSKSLEKNKNN